MQRVKERSPHVSAIPTAVEHVWKVMAHAQKQDSVFQGKGRVHLNQRVSQFSRLLAAVVSASAVLMLVMLDTPCSEVEWKTTGYPIHSPLSPSLPLPCVTVCHQVSTELYIQQVLLQYAVPTLLHFSLHHIQNIPLISTARSLPTFNTPLQKLVL